MITPLITTDESLFDECLQAASAHGMHLIGNGQRVAFSPVIPAGWVRLSPKVINTTHARLEVSPCNA